MVKDKEQELSDLKSNMDKTAKEKRERDEQVNKLQNKIRELEELVRLANNRE